MFSALTKRINNYKITRRFPIRWLTYRARVHLDVSEAFNLPAGKELFDYNYVDATADAIKQLENWQIKLMLASFAISAFLIIGFITDDTSISLFGVSIKKAAGLKEVLIAFATTIGILLAAITQSKETLVAVLQKLTELSADKTILPLASLASRSSFHLKVYLPRQYDQWIFPTIFTKLLSLVIGLLWILISLIALATSFGLTVFIAVQIYLHPTLGVWSTVILYYVAAALLLTIVSSIKLNFPMPYRDKSDLKKMSELEKTNRSAYLALQKKYFGS